MVTSYFIDRIHNQVFAEYYFISNVRKHPSFQAVVPSKLSSTNGNKVLNSNTILLPAIGTFASYLMSSCCLIGGFEWSTPPHVPSSISLSHLLDQKYRIESSGDTRAQPIKYISRHFEACAVYYVSH